MLQCYRHGWLEISLLVCEIGCLVWVLRFTGQFCLRHVVFIQTTRVTTARIEYWYKPTELICIVNIPLRHYDIGRRSDTYNWIPFISLVWILQPTKECGWTHSQAHTQAQRYDRPYFPLFSHLNQLNSDFFIVAILFWS